MSKREKVVIRLVVWLIQWLGKGIENAHTFQLSVICNCLTGGNFCNNKCEDCEVGND